ncbi:putative porin [Pseudomonas huanghezhanensis]|uniref:putative porin n=1 Tax=Pseudomonas huanghezhanensis TaxID=3002903 RepID=UPI002286856A|nr:putative porin [Pseudomonas sp. BSw22131]
MNLFKNRLSCAASLVLASLALPNGAAAAATPSESATVNLIRLLVEQGVLKEDKAQALIRQAETEAVQARQAAANTAIATSAPAANGEVRVQYVPAIVRDQIRDQVKAEVMATARQENWAAPNTFPDWASRITFDGDVRLRDESRYFGGGNSNQITDFGRLNTSGPFDVNPNTSSALPPLYNTTEDRSNLMRLRARFGLKSQLADSWVAGVRLGTGADNSPVSTTQTLGGGFAKKDIWLDQGYVTYSPSQRLSLTGGRFSNPFFATDMLYSRDLNFDGVAAVFNQSLNNQFNLFGTVGAFPVEYTNDSASESNGLDKTSSNDKWLYGAQVGVDWKINTRNSLKGAMAYYRFDDIEGQRSAPCQPWNGDVSCSTDGSRSAFMQKGNTLFLLRDITPDPANPTTTPNPQYVGLASKFDLLDLNLRWDTELPADMKLRTQGNYIRNLSYDSGEITRRAAGQLANNVDSNGSLLSGGNAWMMQFTLGSALEMGRNGDWNVFAGYKRIEPDAMPDGFNDSTFHLGGTNAKGYYLGANYGFAKNVFATTSWMSTKAVYGAPFDVDILQLDLNTRF